MENSTDSIAGAGVLLVIMMAIAIFMIAAVWKIFTKAGQPGWAVLIPIYNAYILLKIAGKPGWWLLLMFIPLVNLVVGILAIAGLSANFGKGGGFVIGLLLLPFIFYAILGFGSAEYNPVNP